MVNSIIFLSFWLCLELVLYNFAAAMPEMTAPAALMPLARDWITVGEGYQNKWQQHYLQ